MEWKGTKEARGNGLEVEAVLWGHKLNLLVDTGATVNLLSTEWWKAYGRPGRLRESTATLSTADGKALVVEGQVHGELECGGHKVVTTFVVANIGAAGILGADFIRRERAVVDLAGERLLWGERGPARCRVVSRRHALIEGGTETVVEGELLGEWTDGCAGMVEGLEGAERDRGFRVGRSLVSPEEASVPILVCNPGPNPVTLYRDMGLATLEEVAPPEAQCRVVMTAEGGSGQQEDDAVERLLDDLMMGVVVPNPEEWRGMLRRNADAFQLREGDMGHTTIVVIIVYTHAYISIL